MEYFLVGVLVFLVTGCVVLIVVNKAQEEAFKNLWK